MRTIQEKFQFYSDQIKQREDEFVKLLNLSIQPIYYEVSPNGQISEVKTTYVSYWSEMPYFDSDKRKTRKDLEKLVYFYNNPPELKEDRVRVHYEKYYNGPGKMTGANSLKTIMLLYPTRDAAEIVQAAKIQKIQHEEMLLQNGHFRCQRCRQVTKNEDKVTAYIIGRAWDSIRQKQYVKTEAMDFCSGNCAGCEQMSREG